jgi:tRNA threonylcarbamoyladenosine biosynthesis protein TsaB
MLTLALDTTTRAGSCALARDGVVISEAGGDDRQSHDARLPGELMSLLEGAAVSLDEIDLYAVAIGPGSFTGLRVGIATMQGLAYAAGKPLIGVSGFDALARIAGDRVKARCNEVEATRIATWVDAWRGEVFASLYAEGREIEPPTVAEPRRLLQRLTGSTVLFIGDGADVSKEVIFEVLGSLAQFGDPMVPRLAGTIATIATELANSGHRPPPHAIAPLYVRRSDAELARDARTTH